MEEDKYKEIVIKQDRKYNRYTQFRDIDSSKFIGPPLFKTNLKSFEIKTHMQDKKYCLSSNKNYKRNQNVSRHSILNNVNKYKDRRENYRPTNSENVIQPMMRFATDNIDHSNQGELVQKPKMTYFRALHEFTYRHDDINRKIRQGGNPSPKVNSQKYKPDQNNSSALVQNTYSLLQHCNIVSDQKFGYLNKCQGHSCSNPTLTNKQIIDLGKIKHKY